MLPNCPQYIFSAFAVLRLGAIVVNINPSYTAREVLTVATDSGVRIVITLDVLAPLVQAVRAQTAIEQIIVTSLAEYSAAGAGAPRVDDTQTLADLLAPVGAGRAAARGDRSAGCRRAAVHRRHDRHAEGRDADPREHLGQRRADRELDQPGLHPRRQRALPGRHPLLPHLRVLGLHDGRAAGRRAADHPSEVRAGRGARRRSATSGRPTFRRCRRCSSRC